MTELKPPPPLHSGRVRRTPGDARPRGALWPLVWWTVKRLLLGVAVIFVASCVVFLATQALPGDAAEAILGKDATPERLEALRAELNLGQPIWSQYFLWLSALVGGDLGVSLATQQPVSEMIGIRLANSLLLVAMVALIAIPVSVLLGVITALKHRSTLDKAVLGGALVLVALPEFVIGMVLVMLFSTSVFHVLPAISLLPPGASLFENADQLVLPVLTLVIVIVPYLYRLIRVAMIEILDTDYVTMSALYGYSKPRVVFGHALPNALVPVIQASAVVMAYLLGGVVVMEYLFRYPGLGTLLTDSVHNRDLPVVQAIVLIYAIAIVLFNILADVATVLVTPRLRDRMVAS